MILLDTHALLWWQADGSRLSRSAERAIGGADSILVSPVSFWEVGLLESKGRIRLDRDPFDWARDVLEQDRLRAVALSPSAALFAGRMPALGFEGDPADAMLYATAMQENVPLVTKDQRIRLFAASRKDIRTLW